MSLQLVLVSSHQVTLSAIKSFQLSTQISWSRNTLSPLYHRLYGQNKNVTVFASKLFFNEVINENSETDKLGYYNGALGALHRDRLPENKASMGKAESCDEESKIWFHH